MVPELFARFFGSLTRFALAGVVGWLITKGVIDDSLGSDLLAAAVVGVPTLIWGFYQKYKDQLKLSKALTLPAGSTRNDLADVMARDGGKSSLMSLALIGVLSFGAMTQMACGKEQIENSFAKTVVALRAARKVTTTQHTYGHIDDAAYKSRLQLFSHAYDSINEVGDTIAGFGEITPGNKQEVLDQIGKLATTVDKLIADGDVGVKNPQSQNDYRRWLLVTRGIISSAKVVIAAVDKPVSIKDLKLPKASVD